MDKKGYIVESYAHEHRIPQEMTSRDGAGDGIYSPDRWNREGSLRNRREQQSLLGIGYGTDRRFRFFHDA